MKATKPLTPRQRNVNSRESRQEAGYKQINVWLTPAAALALQQTLERAQRRGKALNQTQVINDLLTDSLEL